MNDLRSEFTDLRIELRAEMATLREHQVRTEIRLSTD
jgi:hypothetical protein